MVLSSPNITLAESNHSLAQITFGPLPGDAIHVATTTQSRPNDRDRRAGVLLAHAPPRALDSAALLYICSVMATKSGTARSVVKVTAVLTLMLVASIALSVFGNSVATTSLALAIAGGPPLLVGGGYGLFLVVMLTVGRNA